jgi:chemotaxis protein MotB
MPSASSPRTIYRHLTIGSLLISALTLAGCVVPRSDYEDLQTQNQQLQSQLQQAQTQNQQLQTQNQQLQQQTAAQSAQVCRLQGAIKYTVNSDLLFPSGSYEMSARGQQLIAKMAPKLAPFQQDKLVVNGYTDNAPIGAQLRGEGIDSNQILSEKRADNVMRYLISQGVKEDMISAKGYGEQDPVATNDTVQGRAQNRRVEVTLANSGCST